MAIDVNEQVTVWAGFSPEEFWIGAAVLSGFAALSVVVGMHFVPLLGAVCFFMSGGGFAGFMVYRKTLPKGQLLRRFRQDGTFLFVRMPGVRGVDAYLPRLPSGATDLAPAIEDEDEDR